MKMKKMSLLAKLMTWINILSVLIIISLSSTTMVRMIIGTEKLVSIDMNNLVSFVGLAASDYIWNLNTPLLEATTVQLLDNPSIETVTFMDAKNVVIAKNQRKDSTITSASVEEKAKNYRNIKLPILGPKKEIIGFIESDYNLKNVAMIKNDFLKSTFIGTILAQICMCIFLYFFLRKTTTRLGLIGEQLKQVSEKNQESAEAVQRISEEVSAATQEQASSIQETVATLDEITSMVNSTVDGSQNSSKKAAESLNIANEGLGVVREMIQAMEEIDKSNYNIIEEIKKSNEKVANIVVVIQEISQKTNVINDIVFQTKLLSFNASVEAARAGEHGKGFAVVAEEIGNLAQMSGKSSSEISEMLSSSANTVNAIITDTNNNIQRLIKIGNDKVKEGVTVADRCGKVLDNIVENAAVVQTMMQEVSLASREQFEGIKNITIAMNKLDETTMSNTEATRQSFQNSQELSIQVTQLQKTVAELDSEIFGGDA